VTELRVRAYPHIASLNSKKTVSFRHSFRGLVCGYDLAEVAKIDDFPPGPSGTPSGGIQGRLDIAGDWQGTFGEKKLHLVVRLTASDDGAWIATLYSIDQSIQPIPIDAVVLEGRSLKFAVNAIRGTYEGTISPDGDSIAGTWIQGKSLPLELQRATRESAWLSTPTHVHFIEVEEGVKLEVVDWVARTAVSPIGRPRSRRPCIRQVCGQTDTFLPCLRHHTTRVWSLQRFTHWLLGRPARR
jgi:hypothetical protein